MELCARVWYTDNPDEEPTGPFSLPDETGAGALVHDLVLAEWYKTEIMDQYENVLNVVIRQPGGEYAIKKM
jgi:hypothetical protein